METIYQLKIQRVGGEPEIINTKIGKNGYKDLKLEKSDLRREFPDEKNVKIWITPPTAERKEILA